MSLHVSVLVTLRGVTLSTVRLTSSNCIRAAVGNLLAVPHTTPAINEHRDIVLHHASDAVTIAVHFRASGSGCSHSAPPSGPPAAQPSSPSHSVALEPTTSNLSEELNQAPEWLVDAAHHKRPDIMDLEIAGNWWWVCL